MKALRFLIVEDHPFQRQMLEKVLRVLGAENILAAANGVEAIRMLRAEPADIVITDLMMPDVDGIELIPLLRKHADSASIILTSADDSSLRVAIVMAKAQGLRLLGAVGKPITPEKLKPLIERHLGGQAVELEVKP